MNKNVIFICLLLSFLSNAYSLSDRFLTYCKHTNHAELNIMDGKSKDAVNCYDSAFSLYAKPLAKDIHNAIVCAKKTGDEQKIKKYLSLMIATKNLNPKYYSQKGLLKYLSKEDKESIQKKYTDKIKSEDYQFIQKLIQEDHAIRTQENYRQRYDLILKTDSITYEKYKARFGDSDPGEELTLDFPDDSGMNWILFRHWTAIGSAKSFAPHWENIRLEVIDRLTKLVEDLKFLNYAYAFQCDAKAGDQFNQSGHGLVMKTVYLHKKTRKMMNNNDKIHYTQFLPEHIIEIDKRRAEIGLETYQEYVKKIDFFTKHKEFSFPTAYSISYTN